MLRPSAVGRVFLLTGKNAVKPSSSFTLPQQAYRASFRYVFSAFRRLFSVRFFCIVRNTQRRVLRTHKVHRLRFFFPADFRRLFLAHITFRK